MKIYLTRHGQDLDNARGILNGHRDEPLTDLGKQQALSLAQNIKEHNLQISEILSSPLSRAYQTAKTIADLLELQQPKKIELLIERDFGVMTGKPVNLIEQVCSPEIIKTNTITYFLSPEGAETFPQLITRAKTLLHWVEKQNFPDNILLVTHGDIGKMIYAAFYGLPWQEVLTQFHFGNTEILLLENNSDIGDRHIMKVKQHNH